MANDYYNYAGDFIPGAKIRSLSHDQEFAAIEDGFDLLAGATGLAVGAYLGGPDTGTADNYVVTNGTNSNLTDLQLASFIPVNTNTGPAVMALNGGTNESIVRNDGTALEAGDLVAGVPILVIWDEAGDRWVLIGATAAQTAETSRTGITPVAGTTYTLLVTDENKVVICSSASAVTVTVPNDTDASLPIGYITHVNQAGDGQVTIAPGAGVTLNTGYSLLTRDQFSSLSVIKTAANTYLILGDMATA